MGERDLTSTPAVAGGSRLPWLGPAALLLLLTVLQVARPATSPASPVGLSNYLAAASLAGDGDRLFLSEDLERLRQLPQGETLSLELARRSDGEIVFPGAGPEALWLAPFVAVAGLGGAVFGTGLAVVWAMALAARTLRQRMDSPWGLLLLLFFGSSAIFYVMEPGPEALRLAAVVAAAAIALRGKEAEFSALADMYDDRAAGGWSFAVRWAAVGLLLGCVVASHPIYALLLLPVGFAVPSEARRPGWAWLGAGIATAALLVLLLTGSLADLAWLREIAVFSSSTGFPLNPSSWGAGEVRPGPFGAFVLHGDPALVGWNLLFLGLGRTVGILPYCLPVIVVLALWQPRSGRTPLVAATALLGTVAIVFWPFDWAGPQEGRIGNALLLPAFGALWLLPGRPVRLRWLVATAIASGLFLWPVWMNLLGLGATGSRREPVTELAARWLPVESTLRVDDTKLVREGPIAARAGSGGLSVRQGALALEGGRWGDLVVISPRPLETVQLSFDGQAGTELEVAGAELGSTVFRGDGGVAFELRLERSDRRHRIWWSTADHSLYDLRLRLPKAPSYPVAFRFVATDR